MAVFFFFFYVKLQDAFAAETGAVGSHAKIGYVIPASSNFTYSDPNAFTADNTTNLGVLTEAVVHWQADNSAKLNDCAMHSKWQIQLSQGAKGGQISYSACLSANAKPLTANFEAIGASATPCTLQ